MAAALTSSISNAISDSVSNLYYAAQSMQLPILNAMINYIHPENSKPIDNPLPVMTDPSLVTAIYYNVLFPQERQNQHRLTLLNFFYDSLVGENPNFLTQEQLETLTEYPLTSTPKKALILQHANYTLAEVQKGKSIEEALSIAQNMLEQNDFPAYKKIFGKLIELQSQVPNSPSYKRYTLLINAVQDCIDKCEIVLKEEKNQITLEFTKNQNDGIKLLEKTKKRERTEKIVKKATDPELFENRLKVIQQAVNNILDKTPNAATILAFQEATPDAVEEMKTCWSDRNFTWISINNTSDKPTEVKSKESVLGESSSFTSTLALSRTLQVEEVALGALPSPSGSVRKILGVKAFNTNTGKPLAIFTTHTDHDTKDDLYHKTTVAIHNFVTNFLMDTPDMPRVFGGDLNAFETSGAAEFIHELRQGPFAGGQDYREGENFYVPSSITDTTFLGRERDRYRAEILPDGKFTANALDHILTKHVEVIAGTRSAAVYDESGMLVDPYRQPKLHQQLLIQRKTASDHLLNAVVFRA